MSAVAVPMPGVIAALAAKNGMDPRAFEATLRATVFPADGSREAFAAFCLIANKYGLDPILKQIYAYPDPKRGIVVIVGVDGWVKILQDNEDYDGVQFEDEREGTDVISITCRIFRKGMTHPTEVREYAVECTRDTPQWKKYPIRMLRHKALIQCIRYAYGISGIHDEDEYERIIETQPEPPQAGTQGLKRRLIRKEISEGDEASPPEPPPEDIVVDPALDPALVEREAQSNEIAFREEVEQAKTVEEVDAAVKLIEKHPKVKELREVAAVKIGDLNRKK
jgi:phage recombination protein Bet